MIYDCELHLDVDEASRLDDLIFAGIAQYKRIGRPDLVAEAEAVHSKLVQAMMVAEATSS